MEKAKEEEEKKVFFQIRIEPSILKEFRGICKEKCMNGSEITRQLLLKWIKENKS